MKISLVKACEFSSPLANGRQCMIGIFDNIIVPFIPVDHPPFCVCIQIEFDQADPGSEHEVFCRFIDPDARSLFEFPLTVSHPRDPNGGDTRIFISINVPGLRIDHLGDHRIEVLVDGQKLGEENIPVLMVQPQSAP